MHGVYVLFRAGTLEPAAVIDGAELTAIRTAAVSGLGHPVLARPEASRLVVFGAGVQARAHVEAMLTVRTITHIIVVAAAGRRRRPGGRPAGRRYRCRGRRCPRGGRGDIVCCCTTSGSRSSTAFCYSRAVTSTRSAHTSLTPARSTPPRSPAAGLWWTMLMPCWQRPATCRSRSPRAPSAPSRSRGICSRSSPPLIRQGPADITVFNSVGVAWQDLIIAAAVLGE